MTSYFRLYRSSTGWRWTMRASGRVIGASSEAYVRRDAALKNMNRVTRSAFRVFTNERKADFNWREDR